MREYMPKPANENIVRDELVAIALLALILYTRDCPVCAPAFTDEHCPLCEGEGYVWTEPNARDDR